MAYGKVGVIALLFSIYIDNVVKKVNDSKLGCYIKWVCTSIFLHANDILIVAPSVTSLQQLLHLCEQKLEWFERLTASSITLENCYLVYIIVIKWRDFSYEIYIYLTVCFVVMTIIAYMWRFTSTRHRCTHFQH